MNTITTSSRNAGIRPAGPRGGVRRLPLRFAGAALAAAIAAFGGGAAHAAGFAIHVVDELGAPVVGASVCVGLDGNYRQFGTAFTDLDGRAEMIEVPNVPLVVTISKTRFTGMRLREPARGFDVVRELTLAAGLPGPRCKAGSSMAANPPVIDVRDVTVAGEGAETTLTPRVTGEPSEYRIARDGDFSFGDGGWRRFDTTIALPGALADAASVVLQLRRQVGRADATIEAVSEVVTVELAREDDGIASDG